jgi:hypothetical protein
MEECIYLKTSNPLFFVKYRCKEKQGAGSIFSKCFSELILKKQVKEKKGNISLNVYKDLQVFRETLPFKMEIFTDKIFVEK